MTLCLIYLNYFSVSTPTQMNDFDHGHYFNTINQNKGSVVEPDVKPAAVMNHSTLEGVSVSERFTSPSLVNNI